MRGFRAYALVSCATAVVMGLACGDTTFSGDTSDSGVDGSVGDGAIDASAGDDGATEDGQAPAGTQTIASGQDNPHDLAIRNGRIYWTNYSETNGTGSVWSANVDGTDPVKISDATKHANRVAADGTLVYWTDYGTDTMSDSFINVSPLDGGSFVLHENTVGAMGIAFNDDTVFAASLFRTGGAGVIIAHTKDGSFLGNIAMELDDPVSVAADNAGLVWTQSGAASFSGQVVATYLDGSVISDTSNLAAAWGIAMSGTQVYYTEIGNYEGGVSAGSIGLLDRSSSLGGGNVITTGNHPYFITVDTNNLYWTEEGTTASNGAVRYAKLSDLGNPQVFASGQGRPHGIAVDAQYIYWTSYERGRILRAPLP